jgi:hypothetical protein
VRDPAVALTMVKVTSGDIRPRARLPDPTRPD